ncbi:MAG: transcription-repair coupling factor [Anaerovoracaceae bacterium]
MNQTTVKNLLENLCESQTAGIRSVSGITEDQTAYIAAAAAAESGRQIMIVTASYERAKQMEEALACFGAGSTIRVLPEEERSLFVYEAKSRMLGHQRIEGLSAALSGEAGIFVVPAMAACKGMCSPEQFRDAQIHIRLGQDIDFEDIRSRLTEMGYERVEMTEVKGQYSIRGEIIDIFPPDLDNPVRIDLFDTEVTDLKQFDPLTQRSMGALEKLTVSPSIVPPPESEEHASCFWDYLNEDAMIFADDWDRICEQRDLADRDWSAGAGDSKEGSVYRDRNEVFADLTDLGRAMAKRTSLLTMPFRKTPLHIDRVADMISINCMAAPVFNGRMDTYGSELRRLLKEGYEIHVMCATAERRKNLEDFARRDEIEGTIHYEEGFLRNGFYFTSDLLAYISDSDIFRTAKKKRRKKSSGGKQIKAFTDLKKGDYVVHENHGIGRFVGIEPLVVEGIRKDYMTIQYAGKDILYVPVEQMDLIQSYIGSGGEAPKVNRLSSGEWKKTKSKARAAIANMAEELVRLSAERMVEGGYSFGPDTPWQRQFEEMFPYEETADQLRCIEEIKTDMEMPWPMDRLLCGDVGFGKTEVAARAVFKCIMEGKQAAILVPTTILANQHYHTFVKRFENFPCTVDLLCRFRSEAQQAKTIEKVKDGSVDILIGTHRMLSEDVKFKDLGLLVIDEEQRFGVQHKEKIKQIKKNVDVLAVSATPIPRTLHMSLSGIRKMSTLEEPPEERYPVQTYVMEQEDRLIREIILREIDRGGQVFVVFNRVKGINQVTDGLRHLVPEAGIQAAHGQMAEGKLEDIMQSFMDHEFDVLVCTTIIESGIDVPNANTLIILDADNFGLAQLYQLKGRVGRSNRAAYAYFMYKKDKVLSEVATKRLRAIREFTEFGSGFRIAMKDLEIRGAGNILGTEQSGHMMQIGYELYCKLMDEAVRRIRGEKISEEELEVSIEIRTDAYISSDYIEDEKLKLDMYKRIAEIRSSSDMADVADELTDRFGPVPPETVSLMQVACIQSVCRAYGIRRIYLEGNRVFLEFVPEYNGLTPEVIARLSEACGMKIIINAGKKPYISMTYSSSKNLLAELLELLLTFDPPAPAPEPDPQPEAASEENPEEIDFRALRGSFFGFR